MHDSKDSSDVKHSKSQQSLDFERISRAIAFLIEHRRLQPSLQEIAAEIQLSPFHFQKIFTKWAGVSPKQFLRFINVEYAKKTLRETQMSLAEATHISGFSSTARLHDLFVSIEGMTPGEYKQGGKNLVIAYAYYDCPFGDLIIGATDKGICHMTFIDSPENGLLELKYRFPAATLIPQSSSMHHAAMHIFDRDWAQKEEIKLHLKGSPFQLKVWQALLQIPVAGLTTYGTIAKTIDKPKAARAVGTAIGDNPVAFIIPCHRVIQQSGIIGQYHWGRERKNAIIGWEAAKHTAGDNT